MTLRSLNNNPTVKVLKAKAEESLRSVLPIVLLVQFISFVLVPVPTGVMLVYLLGAAALMLGMSLFNLGTDLAMSSIGEKIGAALTRTRKIFLILSVSFVMGIIVTVSEPDLQVLAQQVPGIPNGTLIWCVALGVGLFLMLSLVRILFAIPMKLMLAICYGIIFVLVFFMPRNMIPIAFDSGGVTTGPMTVPFIMAMGVGVSAIRTDRRAQSDSFGLVALSSVGPVLAVMLLSMLNPSGNTAYQMTEAVNYGDTRMMISSFFQAIPEYAGDVGLALLPILVFTVIFQFTLLKLPRRECHRIGIGLVYTMIGLTLFMTGVNVGFLPMGSYLGSALAGLEQRWLLVPIGILMGYFVVKAEPAIHVLSKQVYALSAGTISQNTLRISLCISVGLAVGLAMLRVLTGISLFWIVVPGYALALILMIFTPSIFTAIAFDSGGVASGPVTATFLLPMATGTCYAMGGDVASDAFGLVALVAMMPLIVIQALGLISARRTVPAEPVQPVAEDILE